MVHLVGGCPEDRSMFHPWHRLRDSLPDWTVVHGAMPAGVLGATDCLTRTISLDATMLQPQRRCTLDHELIHAEAGDQGCQHPKREASVARESARRLIPLERLLDVVVWARSREELADELWVDLATLNVRLEHLHPAEVAAVKRVLRDRDA